MISFMSVTISTFASRASCATACFASSSTLWQFAHPEPSTLIDNIVPPRSSECELYGFAFHERASTLLALLHFHPLDQTLEKLESSLLILIQENSLQFDQF